MMMMMETALIDVRSKQPNIPIDINALFFSFYFLNNVYIYKKDYCFCKKKAIYIL